VNPPLLKSGGIRGLGKPGGALARPDSDLRPGISAGRRNREKDADYLAGDSANSGISRLPSQLRRGEN